MALNPNVVVVNPGDLITAQHLNNIRSNLDRLDTQRLPNFGTTAHSGGIDLAGSLTVGVNATVTGFVNVGGNPATNTGVRVNAGGLIESTILGAAGPLHINLNRPSGAAGEKYVSFKRGGSTEIGSISLATISSVAFNTTSDERTKHRDGDAADALRIVTALGAEAFHGQVLDDDGNPDGTDRVMVYAHDVQTHAPWAATGERGAVDADGNPVFQQVDMGSLVPVLLAAVAQLAGRVAALEGQL